MNTSKEKRAVYAVPNCPDSVRFGVKTLKALWSQRTGVSLRTWEVLQRLVQDALAKEQAAIGGQSGATHNGIE
jgi:hypothetical protein